MTRETLVHPSKFLLPIFVTEGSGVKTPNKNLEISYTFSVDSLLKYLEEIKSLNLPGVLLFGVSSKRDALGSEALNRESPVCRAISEIRERFPNLIVGTDVALDPYTDHGHDGLFEDGRILNDETVDVLAQMACLHAQMGAQMVAPSDMMDGRVLAIRKALDKMGSADTLILAYTAKYASAYYGPFRDTLGAEVFGDKRTYQMDPSNRREAKRELALDTSEGADIVMVKPATLYLDVISDFRANSSVPVAAYHVSGECALIEAGVKAGVCERKPAVMEAMTSIFRAGADIVATYYAVEIAKWLEA